jgi:uncharacterized protein YjbI with pentapeptide repeats
MANEEHLKLLKQGVEIWNQWRKDNPEIRPDLNGADLYGAYLHEANLVGADLSGADLSMADLYGADLSTANLSGAYLVGADFFEANLSGANLSGADLYEAILRLVNLSGANLSGANLNRTNLINAYLSGALLRKSNLRRANLSGAHLNGANLREASLYGASLVQTNLEKADLTGCQVYGVSVWDVNLTETIQKDLVITGDYEPMVMVDDLEVAQFVYLLLHHDKLRNVLNAVTERGVLLLGRFSDGGLDTLKALGERLRELGYTPIIFDFDRPVGHDYTETVKTLVGLSRFVIVELSGPSVPYELGSTVFGFERPFALILKKGQKPFFMSRDLDKYPWVLQPIIEFKSKEDLLDRLSEYIVAPAEAYINERQQRFI